MDILHYDESQILGQLYLVSLPRPWGSRNTLRLINNQLCIVICVSNTINDSQGLVPNIVTLYKY